MTEKDLDIAIEKCERIMEFDTRTLENPESENGHIFEKVYDLLQFLRQLQFATDTNVGGNLIDRQAVLDALIFDVRAGRQNGKTLMVRYAEEVIKRIKELPSAQPEIMRCKDCRYNNDCEIQYNAQSGDEFFCGCAERKDNG